MHIPERAVQVSLVAGLDMGHTAFVETHTDRGLQTGQSHLAAALRLLAVHIPGQARGGQQQ